MGIWKDPKRGDWTYRFDYQGKHYGGRGHKLKSDARAAMEERRKEVKSIKAPAVTPITFSSIANEYLSDAERRFVKKTFDYKAYVYRRFIEASGDIPVSTITPQIIHQYLSTRATNASYNFHKKELAALFSFAINRLKAMTSNPATEIPSMPHSTPAKKIPTEEQILRLIVAADPIAERPLVLCLIHTLARVDEILRWTWQDINFEHRAVTLWTRKRKGGGLEADTLPMNDDLYDVLQSLWRKRAQDHWVFYHPKVDSRYLKRPRMMESICKRAGIVPHFGFHAIRHFMATYMVDREKVSKKTISGLLRHKSLQTTEIYLHSIEQSHVTAMGSLTGKFGVSNGVDFDANSRHHGTDNGK